MAKAGFHKGTLGSPFQTEYYGDRGMDAGSAAAPSDEMPRIGSGVLGRRVTTELTRTKRGGGSKSSGSDED